MSRGVEWGSRIAAAVALAGIGLASPDTGPVIKGVFDQLRNPTRIVAGRVTQAIDDPYYWVAPPGTPKFKDTIYHGQFGAESNNPNRIVDTIVQCQAGQTGIYDTNCVQFQPQERQFPETQQSVYVNIAALSVRSRNFNGTEIGFVFAAVNPDGGKGGNTWNGRVIKKADMTNPTNYSLDTVYSRGLPNSIVEYCDPFSDTRVGANLVEVDVQCSDANGTYAFNLDSQGQVVSDFTRKQAVPVTYRVFLPSAPR